MDKSDLERRLEAAEKQSLGLLDEIQNLKAKLAEMQDEPEIPDFPKFKRESPYWSVDDEFTLQKSLHSGYAGEKGIKDDEALYNAFHTEAYAQEFADKCKLIAMMLHCKWYLDRNYVPDWDDCDDKFTVWYNHADTVWTIDYQEIHETPSIYFSTEEAARKCADWLNNHWKEDENGKTNIKTP